MGHNWRGLAPGLGRAQINLEVAKKLVAAAESELAKAHAEELAAMRAAAEGGAK